MGDRVDKVLGMAGVSAAGVALLAVASFTTGPVALIAGAAGWLLCPGPAIAGLLWPAGRDPERVVGAVVATFGFWALAGVGVAATGTMTSEALIAVAAIVAVTAVAVGSRRNGDNPLDRWPAAVPVVVFTAVGLVLAVVVTVATVTFVPVAPQRETAYGVELGTPRSQGGDATIVVSDTGTDGALELVVQGPRLVPATLQVPASGTVTVPAVACGEHYTVSVVDDGTVVLGPVHLLRAC